MHSATALILALSCVSFQAYSLPLDESSVPIADDAEVSVDADASVKTDPEEGTVEPVEPEEPEEPEEPDEASTLTKVALLGNQEQVDDTEQYSVDDDQVSNLEVNQSSFLGEGDGAIHGIKPEIGDKIPVMAQTFAGCGCTWEKTWTCKGSIAMPSSVAGDPCCCCTLGCHKSNRCTNEQCRAIGVDQAAEIAAEEKRIAELLQGADMLIGNNIPAFKVEIPTGQRCMRSKILKACNDQGLHPICDQQAYWAAGGKKCFYLPVPYSNKHLSYPPHNTMVGLDPAELAGMCFFAVSGDNALANTGTSHTWTNAGATTVVKGPGGKTWTFAAQDANLNGQAWYTLCTKNKPQP